MNKAEWHQICTKVAPLAEQLAGIAEKHKLGLFCVTVTDRGDISFSKVTGMGSYECLSTENGPYQISRFGDVTPYAQMKRNLKDGKKVGK